MPAVHRPHVLVPPGATLPTAKDLAGLSYIREGSTTNFVVFYDGSLGANGKNLADALLASCEWEYSMLQGWFGGITPASLPFNVYIDTGSFGAYHANCAATEIHCAAFSGTDPDIVRLVLGGGLAFTLAGLAAGLIGFLVLARLLSSVLYGVTPRDPLTIGVGVGLVALSATVAAFLPARRAARVDPVEALREE